MILLAWLISSNRRKINYRILGGGVLLQFLFALFILRSKPGKLIFTWIGDLFQAVIGHVEAGSSFVFDIPPMAGEAPLPPALSLLRTFAFGVLPTIVFFSSLMSMLYYLGVMQRLVEWIAWIMQRTLRTSGAESLSAAATIFVGQTEAPLVIKPYISSMTLSELNAVMVGGFATIAGGVMAAYVQMGIDAGHLVTASVISAPAALLIAKIMVPETETPQTLGHVRLVIEEKSVNLVEAAAAGATDGLKLALNVGAMLIAFLALLSLANGILGWTGERWYDAMDYCLGWQRGEPWTLEFLLGWGFAPLAWVMGIPAEDCQQAGQLLGIKMVANEFIAYDGLGQWARAGSQDAPSERTVIILTYALSGFANFSSIGIQLGGIGAIAPDRRSDLARLGVRAMIGGTLAAFMTACVAGILLPAEAAPATRLPAQEPSALFQPGFGVAGVDRREPPVNHAGGFAALRPQPPNPNSLLEQSTSAHRAGEDQESVNLLGNSAANDVSTTRWGSSASTSQMGSCRQNSAITCRQAPQGACPPEVATTRDWNDRAPDDTADSMATRSAHTVRPYEAFSTLHPV
jgi:CNT family concentrative nucleoside transporter